MEKRSPARRHGLQEIYGDNVRWAMLESGPLPEPALTALAPQDASCPPHACIASSTPYVEEREALTKSRSGICRSSSLHVVLGIKKLILKKEA